MCCTRLAGNTGRGRCVLNFAQSVAVFPFPFWFEKVGKTRWTYRTSLFTRLTAGPVDFRCRWVVTSTSCSWSLCVTDGCDAQSSNYREKTLEFSWTVLPAPSPYHRPNISNEIFVYVECRAVCFALHINLNIHHRRGCDAQSSHGSHATAVTCTSDASQLW